MPSKTKRRWRTFIEKYASSRWFTAIVAFLAAADAFVVFVPTDILLIAAVLARRKRWLAIALWVIVGSAIGAGVFGFLASKYGPAFVNYIFPSLQDTQAWTDSAGIMRKYGFWGLAVISLGPLPQHAAVAFAGVVHLSVVEIFFAVLLGRSIKYILIAWCCVHAPNVLRKLGILKRRSP